MDTAVFDYEEFYELIEQFALEVPKLLVQHSITASLATRLHGLLDAVETTFTVAVVGQMRSGKSSLLNSLVGADLAVTGVNETTATINWFKYGEAEQCNRFRVVWRDRPSEELPLSEIHNWIGDSDRARSTRFLEFFAPAEFLRQANVVDTPGTRSVIADHTSKLQEFLAARHDAETRRHGGAADAIIYVLMPVARQTDRDLLSEFEQNTRLPGSSPYNSIGVVHKWETLSVEDPLAEAHRKAEQISRTIGELVSTVIPVSAPLAKAAEQFPDDFWSRVLTLAVGSTDAAIRTLFLRDTYFGQASEPGCSLSASERQTLRNTYPLPWPSLKLIIKLGRAQKPETAADFRALVLNGSGILALRRELHRRFFARSRMIKAFSVLSKAWEPCQAANISLRNHKVRYTRLLDAAQDAVQGLAKHPSKDNATYAPVRRYVEETRTIVEQDLRRASEILRNLGEAVVRIQDGYDDMNADLRMLEALECNESDIGLEWVRILRHLFGYGGPEIAARIAPLVNKAQSRDPADAVEQAIGHFRSTRLRSRLPVREILDHAINRLEQIADWLDMRHRKPSERTWSDSRGQYKNRS